MQVGVAVPKPNTFEPQEAVLVFSCAAGIATEEVMLSWLAPPNPEVVKPPADHVPPPAELIRGSGNRGHDGTVIRVLDVLATPVPTSGKAGTVATSVVPMNPVGVTLAGELNAMAIETFVNRSVAVPTGNP